jgi:hypothetical protein
MLKPAVVLALAVGLAACSVADTLVDGFKHVRAVETELEASIGSKPQVGFNWNNGRLLQVTVTFPQLLDARPLRELAETVRAAIAKEYKQTPENIVLGFSLGKSAPGKAAQAPARIASRATPTAD